MINQVVKNLLPLKALWLSLFLLIVFAPLIMLIWNMSIDLVSGSIAVEAIFEFGKRRFILMSNSILLSLFVALGGILFGSIIAIKLWTFRKPPLKQLKWLVLVFAALPPYLHALSWVSFINMLSGWLSFFGIITPLLQGWYGSWFVQLMAFLPVGIGMALLGLETIEPSLLQTARVFRSNAQVLFLIALPLAAPSIFAGAGIIFIFSIMDFSIPSLFGMNVYALEIFAEHSVSGNASNAFMLSLPMLFITTIIVYFSQSVLRKNSLENVSSLFPWPDKDFGSLLNFILYFGLAFLVLQISVPFVGLLLATKSLDAFLNSVYMATSELSFSFSTSLMVAFLSILLAYPAAMLLNHQSRFQSFWWFFICLPIALPAPIVGIGLINVWNTDLFGSIYGSALMPVLASLSRFIPFAALLIFVHLRRTNTVLLDAASIFRTNWIIYWKKIKLPLLSPGLLGAAILVFMLSLGELGATLIIAPPGNATLTMRIYTLLHYGATEMVAGLCLMMLLVSLISGLFILYFFSYFNIFSIKVKHER